MDSVIGTSFTCMIRHLEEKKEEEFQISRFDDWFKREKKGNNADTRLFHSTRCFVLFVFFDFVNKNKK